MMESSFTFLRVRGIPIGAHWSWLLVFGLILWSLTSGLFPATYPGLDDSTYLAMGVVTVVLFFASILLHELGHALQALKEDMRIEGITLWLFGGVARFRGMFETPGAEFRIAIAGPLVSVGLAVAFGVLAFLGDRAGAPDPAQGVVDYLARINTILVVFNMVPALPLDGGRVLRSLLWRQQRSFSAATASAARAGRAFGGVLAITGLLNIFTGGTGGGLWLVLLGWFLVQAAQAEAGMAVVQQALAGRRLRDLMTSDPVTVESSATIQDFLDRVLDGRSYATYPVVEGGRPVGLMPLRSAGHVPIEERGMQRVRDVMVPIADVTVLSPDADMRDAFEALQEDGPRRALVMDDDRLVGLISISDVVRAIELEQALGLRRETAVRRVNPLVWGVVGLTMALTAGVLYHPPLVVLEPGPVIDVTSDISIEGFEVDEVNGRYLLTSVQLNRPSALRALWATLSPSEEVHALGDIIPRGVDPGEFGRQQRDLFRQSQMLAAAAGARAAGIEIDVRGDGAIIEQILPGSPAEEVLETGDVIVAINGTEIDTHVAVQREISTRPPGTRFTLLVEREGRQEEVTVASERLPEIAEGTAGIGVAISTRDFSIDLPFEIEFRDRDVGGPSAGLAYALAIADLLDDRDFSRGRTVATSGTVDLEGRVGPVGGLAGKAAGAHDAGADIFLVPLDQLADVDAPDGLPVRGVATIQEAVRVLVAGRA